VNRFVVAAAQSSSVKGELEKNLQTHIQFIERAAKEGVNLIVFPELSLTGYEPELAAKLAINLDSPCLAPLKALAIGLNITIIAGAPLRLTSEKPQLGAFILSPHFSTVYAKQHLHPGEEVFFLPGSEAYVVAVNHMKVGVAICADISQASHPKEAARLGATLYAAGVLITPGGYAADASLVQSYAQRHHMAVVLANHSSPTGAYLAAGRSAIWDERGQFVVGVDGPGDALVLAAQQKEHWAGKILLP
jgi:predicted amidohydrolase